MRLHRVVVLGRCLVGHLDPPGELNLEGVVAGRTGLSERRLRSAAEAFRIWAEAGQRGLGGSGAPWLGRHAAQRQPGLGDDPVLDVQAGCGGDHGEGVGGALAELEVAGMRGKPRCGAR
jgi:hypothetical protein